MSEEIFKIGKWKTYDNYQCLFCPNATLDKEMANQHWIEKHAPPPPPLSPPSRIIRVDRFGNAIDPSVPVNEEAKE